MPLSDHIGEQQQLKLCGLDELNIGQIVVESKKKKKEETFRLNLKKRKVTKNVFF